MKRSVTQAGPEPEVRGWRFSGHVQGVGFRPHVWRIAKQLGITGEVYNEGDLACVVAKAEPGALVVFKERIIAECPPRARILEVDDLLVPPKRFHDFRIVDSVDVGQVANFPLDTRTCSACLEEVRDPNNRRYRYAFTNCMDCGPRFSILKQLPYDRCHTSMATFALCDDCEQEYESPEDRRFHAQPVACPACGPALAYQSVDGHAVVGDPLRLAASALKEGRILAIKGLGGFHLVCDATNADAVSRLRDRKFRPTKPFAIAVADEAMARSLCDVDDLAKEALLSPENPIVLMPWGGGGVAGSVAPAQRRLGVMLPTTPLHQLLVDELARPLVMTSGNVSGEPPCIDNDNALESLAALVDGFLLHDRPIINRLDDSVVCPAETGVIRLRTARGYAPGMFAWPDGFECRAGYVAMGAHLKNTVAVSTSEGVVLSPQIGDLEALRCQDECRQSLTTLVSGTGIEPACVVGDCHPDYASTAIGQDFADANSLPFKQVPHHHAHVAACLFENSVPLSSGPVLGLAFDGMGLSGSGEIWGGEWLLGGYRGIERIDWLQPRALLGGPQAMRDPWRNLLAIIAEHSDLMRLVQRAPESVFPPEHGHGQLERLASLSAVSPKASSAGRLIDAMASLVCTDLHRQSYEGEAGMALEALALAAVRPQLPYQLAGDHAGGLTGCDFSPLLLSAIADLERGVDRPTVAWRLLAGFADGVLARTVSLAGSHGVNRIVLTGGVFQNPFLLERVATGAERHGLEVLRHRRLSASDENIALGQIAVMAAQPGGS